MVIMHISGKHSFEMTFSEHDHIVEAFSTDRANDTLKHQALGRCITWPELAETRWNPRHRWCRTPRHYSASLGSDASRPTVDCVSDLQSYA